MFSWLDGPVVTHPTGVKEIPGSIPGSDHNFMFDLFVLLLLCFYFPQHTFVIKFCQSFCNFNSFSIFNIHTNILQICDQL